MRWQLVPCVAGLLVLSSCGLVSNLFSSEAVEEPISPDEQYLQTGSTNDVDLGPDQKSLTTKLQDAQKQIRDLLANISRLEADRGRLEASLRSTERDFAQSQDVKSSTQRELTAMTEECRQLETKVLMLQIKNAQLERANILVRLGAIQQQQDANSAPQTGATPMSGAHR